MLHCAKTRRMYMFALHKPGEERLSERSEAVALLSVLLSGVHVGIVSKE